MKTQMKKYTGQGLGGSCVQELLSPWIWGALPPLAYWMCSPAQKLPEARVVGIFMEASSYRHDQLLTF